MIVQYSVSGPDDEMSGIRHELCGPMIFFINNIKEAKYIVLYNGHCAALCIVNTERQENSILWDTLHPGIPYTL